jgi:hypothetical protein
LSYYPTILPTYCLILLYYPTLLYLRSCVAACQDMSFDCEELAQAQALVGRLTQEHLLIASLEVACQSENLDEINGILASCMEQGMDTYYR